MFRPSGFFAPEIAKRIQMSCSKLISRVSYSYGALGDDEAEERNSTSKMQHTGEVWGNINNLKVDCSG
jgi:hypothetical protein